MLVSFKIYTYVTFYSAHNGVVMCSSHIGPTTYKQPLERTFKDLLKNKNHLRI